MHICSLKVHLRFKTIIARQVVYKILDGGIKNQTFFVRVNLIESFLKKYAIKCRMLLAKLNVPTYR